MHDLIDSLSRGSKAAQGSLKKGAKNLRRAGQANPSPGEIVKTFPKTLQILPGGTGEAISSAGIPGQELLIRVTVPSALSGYPMSTNVPLLVQNSADGKRFMVIICTPIANKLYGTDETRLLVDELTKRLRTITNADVGYLVRPVGWENYADLRKQDLEDLNWRYSLFRKARFFASPGYLGSDPEILEGAENSIANFNTSSLKLKIAEHHLSTGVTDPASLARTNPDLARLRNLAANGGRLPLKPNATMIAALATGDYVLAPL